MNKVDFLKVIEIVANNHSTNIIINKPLGETVGDLGTKAFTVSIIDCCASVIDNLKKAGYRLSLHDGMLHVDNF